MDGATHQAIMDLAVVRALPNMTVVAPSDAFETRQMVHAIAEVEGPVYMRLFRAKKPPIYDEAYQVEIGKAVVLQEGSDVSLFAIGDMVFEALEAAVDVLEELVAAPDVPAGAALVDRVAEGLRGLDGLRIPAPSPVELGRHQRGVDLVPAAADVEALVGLDAGRLGHGRHDPRLRDRLPHSQSVDRCRRTRRGILPSPVHAGSQRQRGDTPRAPSA